MKEEKNSPITFEYYCLFYISNPCNIYRRFLVRSSATLTEQRLMISKMVVRQYPAVERRIDLDLMRRRHGVIHTVLHNTAHIYKCRAYQSGRMCRR